MAVTETHARTTFEPLPPMTFAERLDAITDFYVWDVPDLDRAVETATTFAGEANGRPVGGTDVAPWLRGLLQHVRTNHAKEIDFRVEHTHGGELFLYRGHRDHTVGDPILCLRRHPTLCPKLSDLTLPRLWKELLLRSSLLKGGLILIAAVTGQGKSTTTAATVSSRLETYGGFCRTIEDPPELPLHGTHGHGLCIQTPVAADDGSAGFANALRSALRSYPALPSGGTICVVGEVRDGATAADLLRASVNGHLVITTTHAASVNSGLQRLAAMAEQTMGAAIARDLLASGLVYAIHQTLTFRPAEKGWRRGQIGGDFLASFSDYDAVATAIREGKWTNLNQSLDRQKQLMARAKNVDEFVEQISDNHKGA